MQNIRVKEFPTDKKCRCGSWFNHWHKFTQSKIRMCVEQGCNGTDLEGAHVQLADSDDTAIYIVPLCSKHRASKEILSIIDSCKLISADINKTCGVEGMTYLKEGEI